MPNQETKVMCPVCGAEFAIAEHTHVATGIVIGKDSNLGTIHPTLSENPTSAPNKKIAALKAAGVDVSNMFAINVMGQAPVLCRTNEDGIGFSAIPDDDPVFAAIAASKTIPNRRLFRRFVAAQVLHALVDPRGFIGVLNAKGYKYQWRMLAEELRVQHRMSIEDPENFKERNRWFNKGVAVAMAEHYEQELKEHIRNQPVRKCRRQRYIRLRSINIFISDLVDRVFMPLESRIDQIRAAETPDQLHYAVVGFKNYIDTLYSPNTMSMSPVFKDAYKGAGAYFTMKNFILFHDCGIVLDGTGGFKLRTIGSMKKLEEFANEYANAGWRMFGVLKQFLQDNNINIEEKMAEWRKK